MNLLKKNNRMVVTKHVTVKENKCKIFVTLTTCLHSSTHKRKKNIKPTQNNMTANEKAIFVYTLDDDD